MKIFNNLINGILCRKEFSSIVENSSQIANIFMSEKEDDVYFESDSIVLMSSDNYLDATSPENIAKYKSNLKLLIERAKESSKIDKFMLIRNDDFFPYDWEWDVSSKDTGLEKVGSSLAYELRQAIARENAGIKRDSPLFDIPISPEKMSEMMANIDKNIGLIYMPVRFRSTKHFTINTPLAYTGDYNNVESERNFHIIDSIDNFLSSGYAYSASYRDAYLDVTHESLSISENAVVLISEDNYEKVASQPEIMFQLQDRRVIIFKGDEALATNMILTELGVLPSRPGNRFMIYDNNTTEILENSMKNFCNNHSIEYNKGHGNINGHGGHFTDLLDGYNQEYNQAEDELLTFLRNKFPEYTEILSTNFIKNRDIAYKVIKTIGHESILEAINEYNWHIQQQFSERYKKHKENRATITPEISLVFKNTVKAIINYYNSNSIEGISIEDRDQIELLIRTFYHSDIVEDQLLVAETLCKKLGYDIDQCSYSSNSVK